MHYKDVQVIRARYPRVLTEAQQEEILAQIPALYDSNLELGFNISDKTPTESELYYKYIARTLAHKAKECETVYNSAKKKTGLGKVQGHLLYAHVSNACEWRPKKDFYKWLFNAWKDATSPKLFKTQLGGYKAALEIHFRVYGKDSKRGNTLLSLIS